MAKSSINFQRASIHSFKHNSREEKRTAKTVFKEHSHLNEYSRSAVAAKQMFDVLYKEAISKVTGRTRRAKKENCLVEAVVNLNANHTLEDVEKLAKKIEQETGFTCLQIAIHKDEGQEQDGKLIRKNHHAHISFFTLDRETGRQMFRREHLTKAKLSKLQDITAETLGMQRGEKNSERKRLNHKEYKEHIKQVEKERATQKATQKQLKEEIAQLRAELREANAESEVKVYTKDDYAKINKLNRELQEQLKRKELTLAELREQIAELRKALEEKDLKNIKELAELREKLEVEQEKNDLKQNTATVVEEEVAELQKTVETLQAEKTAYKQDIVTLEEQKTVITALKQEKTAYKQDIDELQRQLKISRETIETLKAENSEIRAKYEEMKEAFADVAQAIGIKFNSVKQVVADIISKFKSTIVETATETAKKPEPEPVKKVDDETWKRTVENLKKFNQQNKYPKLK